MKQIWVLNEGMDDWELVAECPLKNSVFVLTSLRKANSHLKFEMGEKPPKPTN